MKKILSIVALSIAAIVLAVAGMIWFLMGQPLYRSGNVSKEVNLRSSLTPPGQGDSDSSWQVEDDIRLFHETGGQGKPVLVLHGGPGVPYDEPWRGLRQLESTHKFYYYHQRGCGRSTRPFSKFESGNFYQNMLELEQTLGLGAQIADIERIRRILGEDQLILIGHSFGGFLATMYAAEFPERVESLILVAPAGVLKLPDENTDLFARIHDQLEGSQKASFEHFRNRYLDFGSVFDESEQSLSALHREFGRFAMQAMDDRQATDSTMNKYQNGGWMVNALYFSMGKRHDYRPALAKVKCPTLIVHGSDDKLTRPGTDTYVSHLPHADLCIINSTGKQKAGHFVFATHPDQFEQILNQFLF